MRSFAVLLDEVGLSQAQYARDYRHSPGRVSRWYHDKVHAPQEALDLLETKLALKALAEGAQIAVVRLNKGKK